MSTEKTEYQKHLASLVKTSDGSGSDGLVKSGAAMSKAGVEIMKMVLAIGFLIFLAFVWSMSTGSPSRHDNCIERAQHRAIYKFNYGATRAITYAEMYCS